MIISDKYRFCFIHIPKCAGSSVRAALSCYDDRNNFYWIGSGRGLGAGVLDKTHLTAKDLRHHFPNEYSCIASYRKFTVLRAPLSRFRSSFKQYLAANNKHPFQRLSEGRLELELKSAIQRLQSSEVMNPWLVHFTPQANFVYDGDDLFIPNLFPLERLDTLYAWVGALVGKNGCEIRPTDELRRNASFAYRNAFIRRVIGPIQPYARCVMPGFIRKPVGRLVKTQPTSTMYSVFQSDFVQDFVRTYYKDDFRLRAALRDGIVPETRTQLAQWSVG